MENLELWNKYKDVPENALKPFNNGKFKGSDINTMWRIKCLTETYGPCGIGWYFIPKKLWTEKCDNGDVFAFAEIELFIKANGEWSMPISGNGGNKMQRLTKEGDLSTSDEAFKMAVTDAFGVACRNLGIGASVYWENDKTKYSEYAVNNEPINTVEPAKPVKAPVKKDVKIEELSLCCHHCGEVITEKVAKYSKEKMGNELCYDCQKLPIAERSIPFEFGTAAETDNDELPF